MLAITAVVSGFICRTLFMGVAARIANASDVWTASPERREADRLPRETDLPKPRFRSEHGRKAGGLRHGAPDRDHRPRRHGREDVAQYGKAPGLRRCRRLGPGRERRAKAEGSPA